MQRKLLRAAAFAGVMCTFFILVMAASASTTTNQAGSPPQPKSQTSSAPIVNHLSTEKVTIGKATFNGSDLDTGNITVLADMMLTQGVNPSSSKCFWTKPGQKWSNGGYGSTGTKYVTETVPGKLCPSTHSPTGWVKVAGGESGRACYNAAKVGSAPGPVVKGKVIWVSSLAHVAMHLRASEKYAIHAVCGHASGEASSDVWITISMALRSQGAAISRFFATVQARAWAKARATLKCVPLKPPVSKKSAVLTLKHLERFSSDQGKYVDTTGKETSPSFGFTLWQLNKATGKWKLLKKASYHAGSVYNWGMYQNGLRVAVCEDTPPLPWLYITRCLYGTVKHGFLINQWNYVPKQETPPPAETPPASPPSTPPASPPTPTPTPSVCTVNTCPKDGTAAPTTTGSPGGAGAGGQPAPVTNPGPTCRNSSGNVVSGTPDASGNCPGVPTGSNGTTGTPGPAAGSPAPPAQGNCLDPVTKQQRTGPKDQFGYCTT